MNDTRQITIAGFGGQGVMLLGQMFAHLANETVKNSLWYPSYGPETRGGTANCAVTISNVDINSPVFSKADTVIALNKPSLDKFIDKIYDEGQLLFNSSLINEKVIKENVNVFPIPINDIALKLGNIRVANMVMLGAYLELNKTFPLDVVHNVLIDTLGERRKAHFEINKKAIEEGMKYIRELKD